MHYRHNKASLTPNTLGDKQTSCAWRVVGIREVWQKLKLGLESQLGFTIERSQLTKILRSVCCSVEMIQMNSFLFRLFYVCVNC